MIGIVMYKTNIGKERERESLCICLYLCVYQLSLLRDRVYNNRDTIH
jgi:hypothetical protein